MKKFAAFFCALALLTGSTFPVQAAVVPEKAAVRFYDEASGRYEEETVSEIVNVKLNGALMNFDVPALTRTVDGLDSRTMVPVRPIAEALGASVLWVEENRQVLIFTESDTIVLTLGSATAVVNGRNVELPGAVPAGVVKYEGAERTMVPLRFVSEQLHATVEWDNDTYTAVVIADLSEPEPTTPETPVSHGFLLRVTPDDKAQTITLYLNAAPKYKVTDLGERVVIDLLGFTIGSGKDGSLTPENPVVDRIRYAQHGDDLYSEYVYTTRVVLDLAEGCTYRKNVTVTGNENLMAVVITVTPPDTGVELPDGPDEDWDPAAFTVALDAGHGGTAPGAVYEDVMEKDITLPITLRIEELLKEKGYNVVMTRSRDIYMDLYDRCEIANHMEADIFVSIHANASSSNLSFQGTYTYAYPNSVEGAKLAKAIQKAVVQSAGSIDRGVLTNNYVVLRETNMPAALLETGFMSCHEELMKLIDPAYQEKLAQGVVKGIENYLSAMPAKTVQRSGGVSAAAGDKAA